MSPSATTLATRISGVRLAFASIAATGLAGLAVVALSSGASAAEPLQVHVGAGAGQVAGQAYLPGQFTVEVGQAVTFTVSSDEPHSVTFGEGPEGVAPDQWPVTGWAVPEAPSSFANVVDLGATTYGGEGFVNTGLLWKASSATASFTSPGSYVFFCEIHPGMSGQVDVVAVGAGGTTTQAQADADAAATSEALLSQVESVRTARLDSVETVKNADGTTTWKIFADASTVAGPLPGGGTGFLQLYEMLPPGLEIGVGDTVHWSASGPHTVSFAATGQDPATIDPFGAAAGSDVYDGTSFYNSGLLNAGPGAPTSYTLTFPTKGAFPYVCALHQFLGQRGIIAVGQPLPSAAAGASTAPAPSAGS